MLVYIPLWYASEVVLLLERCCPYKEDLKYCHFLVLIFKYKCSFYFSWFALLSHACIFLGLFLYYNFHVLFSCCFSGEVLLMLTDRFNSLNIRKQLAQSRVWQNSCQMLHHYILSSVITVSLFSHCVFMSFVLVFFFVSLINIFNLIVTWNQLCSILPFFCFLENDKGLCSFIILFICVMTLFASNHYWLLEWQFFLKRPVWLQLAW